MRATGELCEHRAQSRTPWPSVSESNNSSASSPSHPGNLQAAWCFLQGNAEVVVNREMMGQETQVTT